MAHEGHLVVDHTKAVTYPRKQASLWDVLRQVDEARYMIVFTTTVDVVLLVALRMV